MKRHHFIYGIIVVAVISLMSIIGCGGAGGGGGGGGGAAVYTLTLSVSTEIPTSEPYGYIDVIPSMEGNVYTSVTDVVLLAWSNSNDYMFSSWEGDVTGETSPGLVKVDGNKSILARFKVKPSEIYTLNITISPEPGYGSLVNALDGNTLSPTYDAGEVVFISAEASSGYIFDHWSGDLPPISWTSSPLTMNGNKNIMPVFRQKNKYALTLHVSPGGYGTVGESGTSPYDEGTVVTVTASPNPGYGFDHWGGDLSGSANPATITMNATKDVTAVFKAPETIPDNTYDGTYTGQFIYVRWENGRDTDDDDNLDTWDPVSHAINITVTFQHWMTFYPGTASGEIWALITYVKCDEPTFGAAGGISPSAGTCFAYLPEVIPTSPSNPSIGGERIFLQLPNGFITTNDNPGALHVSGDGRTLSNTLSYANERWNGYTTGSPTFEQGSIPPYGDYIDFTYWNLNRTD
jgi:hypothetical protein